MNLPPDKMFFTTGQTAKILGLASRMVVKEMEAGRLRGVRIPGSPDRRFHREAIMAFSREYNWPLYGVTVDQHIMTIGVDQKSFRQLRDELPDNGRYHLTATYNLFDAGRLVNQHVYDAIIIDSSIGKHEAMQLATTIRSLENCCVRRLVYIASEDDGELCEGFERTVQKPSHIPALVDYITTKPVKPKGRGRGA